MLGEGLHLDVPMDDYISDPCEEPSLSKGTMLRLLTKSAKHAWFRHPRLNPDCPRDDSTRGDLGTAVHSMILGGRDIVYAPPEFEDWRKKDARLFRDDARAQGKTALLARQKEGMEFIEMEAKEFMAYSLGDLYGMQTEGTMIWKEGSVWKRGRFDIWLPKQKIMVDVKTVTSADPVQWIKTSLLGGGYEIQAAHYMDGIRKLIPDTEKAQFVFLLVELDPPHCCSLVGLDPAFRSLAERKVARATKTWKACIESERWPGYDSRTHWAEAPAWAEMDFEGRAIQGETK